MIYDQLGLDFARTDLLALVVVCPGGGGCLYGELSVQEVFCIAGRIQVSTCGRGLGV